MGSDFLNPIAFIVKFSVYFLLFLLKLRASLRADGMKEVKMLLMCPTIPYLGFIISYWFDIFCWFTVSAKS
ncbi:MAG: hypothetical protein CMF36_11650 [Leeuwenhoekiella sp.]|nr:hypothetical protein [Leeuwenhoekiella sp.]